jgi:hypothetical protein
VANAQCQPQPTVLTGTEARLHLVRASCAKTSVVWGYRTPTSAEPHKEIRGWSAQEALVGTHGPQLS